MESETNELVDGSLIDLCGATLLWRSAEGIAKGPVRTSSSFGFILRDSFSLNFMQTTRHLEKMVDDLNAGKPQCPVGLNTLVLPRKSTLPPPDQTPYVYLKCGHVQGLHHWGKAGEERTCPICLKVRFGILTNRIRTQSWSSFVWGSNIRKMVVHLIAG